MKGEINMGDGVKYNSSEMTQGIEELGQAIKDLEEQKSKCEEIKKRMQGIWSGAEANAAYTRLDENIKNIQDMIDIQNKVRNILMTKQQSFDEASTRL